MRTMVLAAAKMTAPCVDNLPVIMSCSHGDNIPSVFCEAVLCIYPKPLLYLAVSCGKERASLKHKKTLSTTGFIF